MSKYDLTIIDVIKHEGKRFKSLNYPYAIIKKDGILIWDNGHDHRVALDRHIAVAKFREIKTSPKIIEWYKPIGCWSKLLDSPQDMQTYYKTKEEFFNAYDGHDMVVFKWFVMRAPENREDWDCETDT